MEWLSVKEYAERTGKSVQAVYKQMKGKELTEQLKGHIKELPRGGGRTIKKLDEEAVRLLDEASRQSPQIIVQTDDKERIEQLERDKEALLIKVAELQEKLIKKGEQVEQLQAANIALLEAKTEKKRWWQRRKGGQE